MPTLFSPDSTEQPGGALHLYKNNSGLFSSVYLEAGAAAVMTTKTAGFGFQVLSAAGAVLFSIPESGIIPGQISGGGTAGKVTKFSAAQAIADSLLSDDGTNISLATGQFLGPDGTGPLPGVSFASDPDTGLFRQAANNIGVALNGAEAFRFSLAGGVSQFLGAAGSQAAPGVSFLGSASTGMWLTGSTLGFTIGGVTAFSSNNTPQLLMEDSAGNSTPALAFSQDLDSGILRVGSNRWALVAGGSQQMRVTDSGMQSVADGQALGPVWTFTNAPTVGLYNAGSNQLGIAVNNGTTPGAVFGQTLLTLPGGIQTGNPASGTALPWKFGSLVTAAVVADTTRYLQVDVNGTAFKVIIAA